MEIKGKYIRIALSLALIALIVWLSWDWLAKTNSWFNLDFSKQIAKFLGISGSTVGFLWWIAHQSFLLLHRKKKKTPEEDQVKVEYHDRGSSWNRRPSLEESLRELHENQ
jgi:hypothetical protein